MTSDPGTGKSPLAHHTSALTALLTAFQHLSTIDNPIEFHIEFEKQQKESGLRLGTFKSAWKAWITQQQDKGGDV